MREEGIVTEVSAGTASVAIEPKPHCEHCNLCARADGGKRVVEVSNAISASPGDSVVLEISPAQIVGTSFVLYVFPLAALIGGVVLGYFLSDVLGTPEKKEVFGLGLGAVGLLAALLVLKAYDRHIGKTGPPQARIVANSPQAR